MDKNQDYRPEARDLEYQRRFSMLIATAWSDPDFLERLRHEPRECLEQFGITVPEGKQIVVHMETDDEFHVIIPGGPPDFGEAIEMDLADNCWKSSKCWNLCD